MLPESRRDDAPAAAWANVHGLALPVLVHGGVRRLPGRTDRGELVFRLEVAAVRVGSPPVLVDEAAYTAARPDPLRCDAPAVLAHLDDGHADA